MLAVNTTVVAVVAAGDDDLLDGVQAANVRAVKTDAEAPALDRAVAAVERARSTTAPYVLHDADPLATVADAWARRIEGRGAMGDLEVAVAETLARWRARSLDLPDYYLVVDPEAFSPTLRHWYLGVLGSAAPARVVASRPDTALVDQLGALVAGPWWPNPRPPARRHRPGRARPGQPARPDHDLHLHLHSGPHPLALGPTSPAAPTSPMRPTSPTTLRELSCRKWLESNHFRHESSPSPASPTMTVRSMAMMTVCAVVVSLIGCSGGDDRAGDRADGPGATSERPTTMTPTTVPPAPERLVRPVLRDHPAGLADQIVAAERAVRDPSTAGETLAGWAHLQQVAYRQLAVTPEWDGEVFARIPPELHDPVRLNLEALRELRRLVTTVRDTVPAWRIVDPPPADVLVSAYQAAEEEFGVPWEYLAAVNLVESAMGRIRGISDAGAQGPMQFLPATWAAYGEGDINDPHDAIRAAARYLADYGGADGDMPGALYAYNHSDHYVAGVTAIARVVEADEAALRGYHHWQVYYLTTAGDVWLPVGYEATEPIPVSEYLATHPQ